jgi:nucleoside-diphosphate-sugar epimerase
MELLAQNSTGCQDAFAGCDAVIHTASPGTRGPMTQAEVHAYVFGTLAILRACNTAGVSVVVMTSGICAASPKPEPAVRRETEWSDPKEQKQSDKTYYGCTKTLAELAAWKYMESEAPCFRLVTILPSCIVGPSLSTDLGMTNKCLLSVLKHGGLGNEKLPNDCWSLIDVRDCAEHHIAAMENKQASGRIFSTAPSLHWNDLYELLKEFNPRLSSKMPCKSGCSQTSFDLTKQSTLGVQVMEMPELLAEAVAYFKTIGVQEATSFSLGSRVRKTISQHSRISSSSYNEFGFPPESETDSLKTLRKSFSLKLSGQQ